MAPPLDAVDWIRGWGQLMKVSWPYRWMLLTGPRVRPNPSWANENLMAPPLDAVDWTKRQALPKLANENLMVPPLDAVDWTKRQAQLKLSNENVFWGIWNYI